MSRLPSGVMPAASPSTSSQVGNAQLVAGSTSLAPLSKSML